MDGRPLRVGVVGIEHLHLFEMVNGLVDVGAETVCHAADDGPLTAMYEGWRTESERRSAHDVIGDDGLDLVVLAGVPSERAGTAAAALAAGRHVLSAKPAVTTGDDLARLDALAGPDGRWWVFFSERLCNRAVVEAERLVHAGAIGDLVAVTGAAPHTLAADSRPAWFFERERNGGILVDLAAHQADQLLALVGPGTTEVLSATVANVSSHDHPDLQDLGRMSLRHTTTDGRTVLSDHHVDWLSPAGLGTWGDVRLTLTGTEGTIEVRSNIDVGGQPGGEHLIIVDGTSARRVDCSGVELGWAERLRSDVEDGTDTFMSHQHTVAACSIALAAQRHAEGER
ncbi:MAG: Gfo/Idh/MocA family oxidoreductase [Acidimicrobiales bacterium]